MQNIEALIQKGLQSEIEEVKILAIKAHSELISWQMSKGVAKEQQIRAAIRTYNHKILSLVIDPENSAHDLKKRFEVWSYYNMNVGLYSAIRLEPPAEILKSIYAWELKAQGLEVYHGEVTL